MSSDSSRDLWLERSRLNGQHLADISYGILFVLTVQCAHALIDQPQKYGGRHVERRRWLLLAYIFSTFALATVGLAGNAKYTQTIWIDQRDSPGGPASLIVNELDFWINRMVVASYLIMSAIMDILLLHRCFVIWNWNVVVVTFMSLLFFAGTAMGILVMIQSLKGAVFTKIVFQLAYITISVSINIIYTLLVSGRLFAIRHQITTALGAEHSKIYTSVAAMVVESAALYSVAGIIFIVAFALHSNVENLVLLSVNQIQGIAQLLIILRVTQGRAFTQDLTKPETLAFAPPRPTMNHTSDSDSFGLPYIAPTSHIKYGSQVNTMATMPSTSSQGADG